MWDEKKKIPVKFTLRINKDSQKVRVVPKQKRGGYVVEINEKRFEVDLCPHVELETFVVSVDRCPYEVLGGESFSTDKIVIDDEEYDIAFGLERKIPVVSFPQGPVSEIKPKTSPSIEIADPGRTITAPMPGVVLLVEVKVGQEVKKDELLMIFEAMKMENRIVSPRDGIVKEIFVKGKNDRINRGDPLFVIE
ncbi:MAG: biotin/lipoyl-containing protein [Candidatus Hodarchaeota archaeon]